MAIEQIDIRGVSNPEVRGEQLRNLNFLNIADAAISGAAASALSSRLADGAGAQLFCEHLDFSAPIFPAERRPSMPAIIPDKPLPAKGEAFVKTDDAAKPKNRYEDAVTEQLAGMDSEAHFSIHTKDALTRDADKFPPVRNAAEGTTTYTIEQIGLSDRELSAGQTAAQPYKRLVTITVPDAAVSLKDCKFEFQDRQSIDQKEFKELISREQKRQQEVFTGSKHELPRAADMAFFTHGIRTSAVSSDLYSLALQLTNGHSVINVDWKSTSPSEEKVTLSQAYQNERKGAAESYPRFEKALDEAINSVGSERTIMIAFSHGAMFDTKYLQHRKDSKAPLIGQVIFTHPDIPCATMPQPDGAGKVDPSKRLYSHVSKETHVIGSTQDLAMLGAAHNDCEPSTSDSLREKIAHKSRQMEIHARLGNGARISRNLVNGCGGTYVMETIPTDKKDPTCHFINMQSIATLINGNQTLKIATKPATAEK